MLQLEEMAPREFPGEVEANGEGHGNSPSISLPAQPNCLPKPK